MMTRPVNSDSESNSRDTSLIFPTAKEVADLHRNADTDRRPESIHHSLGRSHNQSAYGDHSHNGSDSNLLIDQLVGNFSQNLGTPQGQKDAIKLIIQLLAQLGAVDATSVAGTWPEIRTGIVTCNWPVAGLYSAIVPFTFVPAMNNAPRIAFTTVSPSVINNYTARIAAAVTNAGTSAVVTATSSVGVGGTVDVHYIAINLRTFV